MFVTLSVLKLDKFKYSNLLQSLNMQSISLTLFVIKLLSPIIFFNLLHLVNINLIFDTFSVLK